MSEKIESRKAQVLTCTLITCCFILIATVTGWLFRSLRFPETNIVVVYILSVILTARFTKGYVYGIIATIAATAAFNYVFTDPYFTLSVNDPTYFITFAIMTLTSIITSALTSKVKQNALEAKEKEAETTALYQLTNHLAATSDIDEIVNVAVNTISKIFNCHAACLCFDESGIPETGYIQQKNEHELVRRHIKNGSELRHNIDNLRTSYYAGEEFCDWPIHGQDSVLGTVRIPVEINEQLSEEQKLLLHTMIESTAMAMDRFHSVQERLRSLEEATQERYRGNLLRAISHDLRTPLSGIMGTSEMLMGMTEKNDERYSLAEGIFKDADWLHALVENILNLTRLQEGKLILDKQEEAVEEVIGSAIAIMAKRRPDYDISVNIPDDVLLVPMDARLIIQVLVNLLDNAVKHTPVGGDITVSVWVEQGKNMAVFSVADRGCGIAEKDIPRIFQVFYTTHGKDTDTQRGIGLGLAICESVINAHGGTITARNRLDGAGAEFSFSLPMEVKQDDAQK
ncbi:hypothetical protein GCM10008910_03390 [Faecalicatena orotica]|uniref:histidine kinase n=1 Tax=Faecalicatena orotica TaxID=1544 RepID=A0A2Y9BIY3_9FIRM|nr:DUF4118 domain-containing protein [Faecalicatena orotica]PWJ28528.1 two-component system sensor histidine kinase KdpD [Faecalicatena orotica]SSA56349.1 two-component system, OmpR family, sensor histidine kinase KdpD [Faecalicatena orotica]